MKIILSRKGWDSGYGKRANPVFADHTIQSIPIPCSSPSPSYCDIAPRSVTAKGFNSIGSFIREYHPDFEHLSPAHLDPDLDRTAFRRLPDWRPCFGQDNSSYAARHLDNQCVREGDLFLFYGWFDDVEKLGAHWHRKGRDRHVIWGWLQIGEIMTSAKIAHAPGWLRYHPHVTHSKSYQENRIYVAAKKLEIGGDQIAGFGGGGVFPREVPARVLTKDYGKRKLFPTALPDWLKPTRHRQEHVWEVGNSMQGLNWVKSLFV